MQRKSYIKENIFGKSDSKSIISFRKKKKKLLNFDIMDLAMMSQH